VPVSPPPPFRPPKDRPALDEAPNELVATRGNEDDENDEVEEDGNDPWVEMKVVDGLAVNEEEEEEEEWKLRLGEREEAEEVMTGEEENVLVTSGAVEDTMVGDRNDDDDDDTGNDRVKVEVEENGARLARVLASQ